MKPVVKDSRPEQHIGDLARRLLDGGLSELSEREQRVLTNIAKRHHVTRNVNHALDAQESFGDHVADRVARFGGSWTFIIVFIAALVGWILLNSYMLARQGQAFDAYPFIFLNLILSMVAALQAPVILMSQNRQAARDRISAGLDYEVNLKAELEIMGLHDKLDALRIDRLEKMLEAQAEQLRALTGAKD